MQKSIRIMALCLAAVMGMGLGILGQSRAEAAEPVYAGIDISRYQGTVDFDRVAADGIDIVYMRAGEGNDYIDPEYERNYQQAREAGLKSGAYLYVTATTVDEGREQAKFFASLLQGKEFACRPVMDFENLRGLNRQTANDIALAFLQTLEEETGVTPAIYTGAYKVEAVWDADLAAYPLWIAEYGAEEPKTTGAWKEWSGFQYTDKGQVDGIDGDVDLDRFRPGILLNGGEPTPEPTASPKPSITPKPTVTPKPTTTPVQCPTTIPYIVQRGDTLSRIADSLETTVAELAALNHLKNPDRIYVGQRLLIPIG